MWDACMRGTAPRRGSVPYNATYLPPSLASNTLYTAALSREPKPQFLSLGEKGGAKLAQGHIGAHAFA